MFSIYKRELKGYFTSPIGYAVVAAIVFFASLFFILANIASDSSDMSGLFQSLIVIFVFLIPVLTMRTFSEEKRQKTDQLWLTAPVSLFGVVFGKFLAALTVYAIGLSSTVIFALVLGAAGTVQTWVIVGNIVGMLLLGAALIAVGVFLSNVTESQVVAAVLSIVVLLLLYFFSNLTQLTSNATLQAVIKALSISERYNNFAAGIFDLSDTFFYLSVSALFLFFTTRMLEKRRWS